MDVVVRAFELLVPAGLEEDHVAVLRAYWRGLDVISCDLIAAGSMDRNHGRPAGKDVQRHLVDGPTVRDDVDRCIDMRAAVERDRHCADIQRRAISHAGYFM